MKITFLTSLFPKELEADILKYSIGPTSNANNALQWSLLEGLSEYNPDMHVISLPNIGAYPTKYKKMSIAATNMNLGGHITGESAGFLNLIGVKHYSRYLSAKAALKKRFDHDKDDQHCLIIYDLHGPFMKAASEMKKRYPNLKVCLIVPDILGFTGIKDSVLYKVYLKIEHNTIKEALDIVNGYVLLSKHMKEKLPVGNKAWTVVEGIYSESKEDTSKAIPTKSHKTLFYSGSLDRRNGIMNLVQAFRGIEDPSYRLVICGDGDTREEILSASAEDKRIDYQGQIKRERVLALQRGATLLINPRTPEGEYTRYSFPSKTMEYLASGVPTLIYKLEGVPEEYFDYSYVLDDSSVEALTKMIVSICEQTQEHLDQKGQLARNFVLNEKNPITQCKKIQDLICKL